MFAICFNVVLLISSLHRKCIITIQFNSIQYFNGNSTVYWPDPITLESTSQDVHISDNNNNNDDNDNNKGNAKRGVSPRLKN